MGKAKNIPQDLEIGAGQVIQRKVDDSGFESVSANGDYYKYKIVPTVSSGNLTVTLKNYLLDTPSAGAPVKVQIGGVVRTITSGLSIVKNAGTNWVNCASSELATKEVDLFVYLTWNTASSSFGVYASRFPGASVYSDFTWSETAEKGLIVGGGSNYTATDQVTLIGRFTAILSTSGSYTWSLPGTGLEGANVVNEPVRESRTTDTANYKMKVIGDSVELYRDVSITINTGGQSGEVDITYPITYTNYTITNGGFDGNSFASLDETCFPTYNNKVSNGIRLYGLTRLGVVGANRTATLPIFIKGKW